MKNPRRASSPEHNGNLLCFIKLDIRVVVFGRFSKSVHASMERCVSLQLSWCKFHFFCSYSFTVTCKINVNSSLLKEGGAFWCCRRGQQTEEENDWHHTSPQCEPSWCCSIEEDGYQWRRATVRWYTLPSVALASQCPPSHPGSRARYWW